MTPTSSAIHPTSIAVRAEISRSAITATPPLNVKKNTAPNYPDTEVSTDNSGCPISPQIRQVRHANTPLMQF
jgi:hypothetical protein